MKQLKTIPFMQEMLHTIELDSLPTIVKPMPYRYMQQLNKQLILLVQLNDY